MPPGKSSRGGEDQDPAELPGIALAVGLACAGTARAPGRQEDARIEHPQPGAVQTGGSVRTQGWIDEERAGHPDGVAERGRLPGLAVPDHDDGGAECAYFRLQLAQLCGLLAAEDSAEMAHEEEHDDATLQERGQRRRSSCRVEDRDAIEARQIHVHLRTARDGAGSHAGKDTGPRLYCVEPA